MKITYLILAAHLLFNSISLAAPIQVFGPKEYSAKPNTAKYVEEFKHSQKNAQGVITVINGNGKNIELEECPKSPWYKVVLCRVENEARELKAKLTRPTNIEISLNGKVIVTSKQLPLFKGQYQTAVMIQENNRMLISVKGLPTAQIKVGIKAESSSVNLPPVANFTFNPNNAIAPVIVSFSGLTSTDDQGIASYDWQFGDGGVATGAVVNHLYNSAGNYTVKLSVKDSQGAISSISKVVTVLQNQVPTANFLATIDPTNQLNVVLDASSSTDPNNSIAQYSWDFGDGQIGSGINVSHAYQAYGAKTISLTVTNANNLSNTISKSITLVDTIPPNLAFVSPNSGQVFFTNTLPAFISTEVQSSEALSSVKGHGIDFVLVSPTQATASLPISQQGPSQLTITGTDLAGNSTSIQQPISVIFDNTAPVIQLSLQDGIITNNYSIDIPINIQDANSTWTHIYVNGVQVLQTGAQQFTYSANLAQEGLNIVKITTADQAGNTASVDSFNIYRDTTPPVLSSLSPGNNVTIRSMSIPVSGTSNEELARVTVNGLDAQLTTNKFGFNFSFISNTQGPQVITISATDLIGNSSQYVIPIQIDSRLLLPQLVSIIPAQDGQHLIIVGASSAVRAGAEVKATTGLLSFNTGQTTANIDGSFQIQMDQFNTVTIDVKDLQTGETDQMVINYGSLTKISGIVKDSNDVPLVGATVGISGTNRSTTTSGTGTFTLDQIPSGDQTLYVDGTTVIIQANNKKFSKTNIAVNIGLGQNNVLPNPIYLSPVLLDGSATIIASNSGGNVINVNAPGVELSIPANSTSFPNGLSSSEISLASIPADRATVPVPPSAVPTSVIALEPSGTSFSQRVSLILPNDNALPPGVEMIILSMNSKTGKWEVDGLSEVDPSGQSVISKPGQGISHFSLVYAVPASPVIEELKDRKIAGIDASAGSMSSSIQLPSYKAMGADITPGLIYKSSWAAPTAMVSNWFDIPKQQITLSQQINGQLFGTQTVSRKFCDNFACNTDYRQYLLNIQLQTNQTLTSWYQPDSVRAQFFYGTVATDEITFSQNDTQAVYNLPSDYLPGTFIKGSVPSEVISYKGIPNQSVLTFATELRNPATNEYLPSGIYPSMARYQVRLKNLTLTTSQTRQSVYVDGTLNQVTYTQKSYLDESKGKNILAPDLISSIIVQNKTHSPYGRGWQVTGSSQIVNPNSSRIVVEEPNGEISTYALNNPISTVFNGDQSKVDLTNSADFSQWPMVAMVKYENGISTLVQKDLSNPSSSLSALSIIPQSSGTLGIQGYYTCPSNYSGTFNLLNYPYTYKAKISGISLLADGSYILTNEREHSILQFNGSFKKLAGTTNDANFVLDGNLNYNPTEVDQYCKLTFGDSCGSAQIAGSRNCSIIQPPVCPAGTFCKPFNPPVVNFHTGIVGFRSFSGDGISGALNSSPDQVGVSSPTSTLELNGKIYFADYGNNRIRVIDILSGTISTFAGKGINSDNGDGGLAIDAGIFHPTALASDSQGNIYISSAAGYIRRVNTNGIIEKIGGLPLSGGGVFTDEAPALQMYFNNPMGLAVDSVNNQLFVSDTANNRVMRIDLNTKIATLVAGNGQCSLGNIGDLGPALSASLCGPTKLSLDSSQNLIVLDSGHNAIRKINFTASQASGSLAFSPTNKDSSSLVKNSDGTWARHFRNGNSSLYDSQGLIQELRTRDNKVQRYSYNSDGTLASITDPSGQSMQFNYSGGKISSIRDPSGRTTSFQFNNEFLSSVVFPDGTSKSFEYDPSGLINKEYNSRGLATVYQYNQYKRLQKVINPDNSEININDFESASAANSYTSNNFGTFAQSGTAVGSINMTVADSKNETTLFSKDINGYVTEVKDALGNITVINRDIEGNIVKVAHPDGASESMTYDSITQDLLTKKDDQTGDMTTFTYDNFGNVTKIVDGVGRSRQWSFDNTTGRLVSDIKDGYNAQSFSYNSLGLISSRSIDSGNGLISISYSYDSIGNLTQVAEANSITNFINDSAGNPIEVSSVINSQVNKKQYSYDQFNRILQVVNPNGDITKYEYLPTGQVSKIIAPNNSATLNEYDQNGRIIKQTLPNSMSYQFSYDPNGNVDHIIDPNGNTRTHVFDKLNRLVQVQLPDDLIEYGYDLRGHLSSIKNFDSYVSITKDSKGRVSSIETGPSGSSFNYPQVTLNYSYSANDKLTSITSPYLNMAFGYNSANKLSQLLSSQGETYGFQYDSAGRIGSISRPGSSTTFSYSANNLINAITHASGGTTKSYANYSYDELFRPSSRQSFLGTSSYTYDQNSQLTAATLTPSGSENFSYDNMGNRVGDENGTYTYDSNAGKLIDDWQYTYSYDNNGNLKLKNSKIAGKPSYQYSYNSQNQLIEIKILPSIFGAPDKQIFYKYDPIGRRISKRIIDSSSGVPLTTERRYIYNFETILGELDGNNSVLATYTASPYYPDDILSMTVTSTGVSAGLAQSTGTFYFLKDMLGSITDITTSSGAIIQRYEYSAFGKLLSIRDQSGAVINPVINSPFAFTGRELDQESGLYYYRARYYDPAIGRFIQEDPHPGHIEFPTSVVNKYAYVLNRPTFAVDPSGLDLFGDIGNFFNGVGSSFLNFGHNFISNFGFGFDNLIKNPGIQFALVLVGAFLSGGVPALTAALKATAVSAGLSGLASWNGGNRSWEAFTQGVNTFISDPYNLRNAAIAGLIFYGAKLYFTSIKQKSNFLAVNGMISGGILVRRMAATQPWRNQSNEEAGFWFFVGGYSPYIGEDLNDLD